MTRSEHTQLHKKGTITWIKGHHHSEESRAKIAAAKKGKHLSEETKARMSAAKKGQNIWSKGRIWVNNGIINKRVYLNQIPNGFIKGRI